MRLFLQRRAFVSVLVFAAIISFLSCAQKPETPPIIGRWILDSVEAQHTSDFPDDTFRKKNHDDQNGSIWQFNNDSTMSATDRQNGKIHAGKYFLSMLNNKSYITLVDFMAGHNIALELLELPNENMQLVGLWFA